MIQVTDLQAAQNRQRSTGRWSTRYRLRVAIVDCLVIAWAIAGAFLIRFGIDSEITEPFLVHTVLALALAAAWWLALGIWGTRRPELLGTGPHEFRGIVRVSFAVFGLLAILSYAFKFDTARGFVGLALPAGVIGLCLGRYALRRMLQFERSQGNCMSRVLVVGNGLAVDHLVSSLRKNPGAGYLPVAACLVNGDTLDDATSVACLPAHDVGPSVGNIMHVLEEVRPNVVAVSAGSDLSPKALRELGWRLASLDIRLILAPALTDVAGPRIHTQPVAGLPLIHVSTPKLTGFKWLLKRIFDVVVAAALLVCLSPILIVVAILVKTTSRGPIFYTQERIGMRGTPFKMYKFRSMRIGADQELSQLLLSQGTGDKPLFKVFDDPRITPVGRILRRYSLDELPQLFNVLSGSMSLVGPRPQRDTEVALYDDAAHRRLYVSPGMSGLWQVSGRSNLSWEEAIQLDLYYVENWSLTQDILILLRTFGAVFRSEGAV